MNYTPFILFVLGFVGILLHNLIKLDRINRKDGGNVNLKKYLSLEKFTILISLLIVGIAAFILQNELHAYLDKFAKYFGTGFVFLGYCAQSILVVLMGRAENYVIKQNKPDTDNP